MIRRRRPRTFIALAVALLASSACATKGDVRTLQQDIAALRAQQDESMEDLARQNRAVLDSLRNAMNMQRDAAGQTSHRFQQLETQLTRTEEIVGQLIQYIGQLNDRLAQVMTQAQTPSVSSALPSEGGSAEEYYAVGVQKLGEGAYATARAAFQAVLAEYPNDPRAADAQYQIAESHYAEENFSDALSALELVPRQWPSSARAPGALYRAGVIAEEMGERSRAREYYRELLQRYPDSDESRQASRRLDEIS